MEHVLSTAERERFEADGFLLLGNVLDADPLERVRAAAAHEDARFRAGAGITAHHVLNLHDLVGRDPLWLELLDWPTTFPKVWGVLGWSSDANSYFDPTDEDAPLRAWIRDHLGEAAVAP